MAKPQTSPIDTNKRISPEKKPSSIANSPSKIAAIIPIVFEIELGVWMVAILKSSTASSTKIIENNFFRLTLP